MLPLSQLKRRQWSRNWSAPMVMPRCHLEKGLFRFLGEEGSVRKSSDWNDDKQSRLWLYNLHYLDDLNARGADSRLALHEWVVKRWTEDNPPMSGVGWEPYPLSLRIVNLVKWHGRKSTSLEDHIQSLAIQSQALSVQVERHILGNHLFANGKALVFAGAFFSGTKGEFWLKEGLRILDREIPEQFLDDGGHFELSPMYHLILLWDLCDLLNLAARSSISSLIDRSLGWKKVVAKGLEWSRAMCHPDGEISFFNDAAFNVSPTLDSILEYAKEIGVPVEVTQPASLPSSLELAQTGYSVVEFDEDSKAILDLAELGPSYQPGHAHADSLSFELSLFGQRVFVNSGTSVYGNGKERERQRSTLAHNTVEIDEENSSQVWSGFRVARRAHPKAIKVQAHAEEITIRCSHDGYRWLPGRPRHTRQWQFNRRKIAVTDRIEGTFTTAVARFHIHPGVFVENNQFLKVEGGRTIEWCVKNGIPSIVHSTWHPEFGKSIESNCLEVRFTGSEITTEFTWD